MKVLPKFNNLCVHPKFNNSCALGNAHASNGSDIVQSLDLDLEAYTIRVTSHGVVLKDFSGCSTLRSVAKWHKPQSVPRAFRADRVETLIGSDRNDME